MFHKILVGLVCAVCAALFAIGALGLALNVGPVFYPLALTTIGGFGMIVFSGLLGD